MRRIDNAVSSDRPAPHDLRDLADADLHAVTGGNLIRIFNDITEHFKRQKVIEALWKAARGEAA
jgi:hypothetical protein